MAAHEFSLMDSYIYGFALNGRSLPYETSKDVAELGESTLQQFPTDAYPNLTELIIEHAMKQRYGYAREFNYELDLILDCLERVRGEA